MHFDNKTMTWVTKVASTNEPFCEWKQKKYTELSRSQNKRCAICGKHQLRQRKKLSIDHNHQTQQVRGLLCGSCNLGLGCFKDSICIMNKAIKYLLKYSKIIMAERSYFYGCEDS